MATPTILILDDDDDVRESLASIFDVLGRGCLTVPSFAAMIEARQVVLACALAILDVNLGEDVPSGVDAYGWLREQAFGGRAVFLTGHARSHPLVAGACALGARVLEKPISAAELRALVDARGAI
jgi:FixJ family two-component response regulator